MRPPLALSLSISSQSLARCIPTQPIYLSVRMNERHSHACSKGKIPVRTTNERLQSQNLNQTKIQAFTYVRNVFLIRKSKHGQKGDRVSSLHDDLNPRTLNIYLLCSTRYTRRKLAKRRYAAELSANAEASQRREETGWQARSCDSISFSTP